MTASRDTAIVLHYVFVFLLPPYPVFGALYYIDSVSINTNLSQMYKEIFSHNFIWSLGSLMKFGYDVRFSCIPSMDDVEAFGQCTGLLLNRSRFETWMGHCVVLLWKTLTLTFIVSLSTQKYKWVSANCQGRANEMLVVGGNLVMDWPLIQRGVVILLVASL